MKHDFSSVPSANIQRSVFNRSSGFKTTFDSGYLVPFFIDEALPGDTFNMNVSMITRLTTPIVPIMDNMALDYFFFSVPYRLLWKNWQKFNGEQENPGDSVDYLMPQLKAPSGGFPIGSIADYFGIPTGVSNIEVNALPFRAYNLIYNEWFRDENLIDSVKVNKEDGGDSPDDFVLLRRGKRHDYFTSCLPWPQKGDGVELALGTPKLEVTSDYGPAFDFVHQTSRERVYNVQLFSNNKQTQEPDATTISRIKGDYTGGAADAKLTTTDGDWRMKWAEGANIGLGITQTDALTINTLREAFQLQRLLERDARGGTRYTELIRSHFGVVSPDARVQRPEYLGGGKYNININPVIQNSATNGTTPQGNLASFGMAAGVKNGFKHSFVEHCFIIGLVCVRADLTYQQGIPRMFSRQTRFDHYWPTLAHLGEQAVLNKEIYAQGNDKDDEVFGYQERFAEYRYANSKITGKMRSTAPESLDVWHLSQKFESLPVLNKEFIQENPPIKRVIAVQNEPEFIMDVFFDLKCARPMPTYAVPGYIDHF
jgi:hypothetical protein